MPESAQEKDPQTDDKKKGSSKGAAIVVVLLLIAAVAVVALLNKDRLLVHSDVSTTPSSAPTETAAPNQPPEILALTVESDRIEPFGLSPLACEAVDPDGDTLTYVWSVTAGEVYGDGPRIEWGSPVAEGLYRVSVTVDDGRGGTADYSVPLRVKANVAPQFVGMVSDTDWLVGGETTRFTCDVGDADGDKLSLEWSATGGELFGEGNAVIWMAPEVDDVYWITVIARDSYGGEARRTLPISVTTGKPPEIDGLFLQGVNTDMLQKRGNDWIIYQGRSAKIVCAMVDTSATYTYEWSVDFGTLVADGNTATWKSPSNRVGATILVVVSDENGNKSSASVLIYVETCTCSF